jgi:hypothetical protein
MIVRCYYLRDESNNLVDARWSNHE